VKWAYDILGFSCDEWQEEEFRKIDLGERFAIWSTGHGVGKTAALAIRGLHFLSTRPFPKVPCTAPSQHQLHDLLWAEYAKWLRRSEFLSKMFTWTQTKIYLNGHQEEWYAVARTSKPKKGEKAAEGLQGFHDDNLLYCVDEGSGVDDRIFSAMDGALTKSGNYAIVASNHTRRTGHFHKICEDPPKQWHTRYVSGIDSKLVDDSYVQNIIETYGKDSDTYRVKILGIAPRASSQQLISSEQISEMHERVLPDELRNGRCVLSCDPARYGDDDSVFYVRRNREIFRRESVHGMDTTEVGDLFCELFFEHDPESAYIDEIGIGAGVLDYVRKKLKSDKRRVFGVNVGSNAKDEKKFFNLRAELFWHIREVIDTIMCSIDTPLLDEELEHFEYGWNTKDSRTQMPSKDQIKAILQRSPDDADSFSLLLKDLVYHKPVYDGESIRSILTTGSKVIPVRNPEHINIPIWAVGRKDQDNRWLNKFSASNMRSIFGSRRR